MRRITLLAFVGVVAFATYSMGCLDRKPAPVCPVPIEIASTRVTAGLFDGVDLLVVVDNSSSMAEEQEILATGFFTLINSLTRPLKSPGADWEYPEVENMRVAVVSSDMGLQYGENGLISNLSGLVDSCEDAKGDDGAFLPTPANVTTVNVQSNVIACEVENGVSTQCPNGWTCNAANEDVPGVCVAPPGSVNNIATVNCDRPIGQATPNNPNPALYAETTSTETGYNPDLTVQVACLAKQGTDGCGVEQQLEAAVRGLKKNPGFLVETHLLAVVIVSDEEDCSIEDEALFQTKEWESGAEGLLNISCNYPDANLEYLFEPGRYHEQMVELKNAASAVIFAGIVGVPPGSQCEGQGDQLGGCLDHEKMKIDLDTFETSDGYEYTHFKPACVRKEGEVEITSARPGRRYVQVAEDFGANAYIYSICNPDWSPAMKNIAAIIARQISATCYPKKLEWKELTAKQKNAIGCPECGKAQCDVVVEIELGEKEKAECPDNLYAGISAQEKKTYVDRKEVIEVGSGSSTKDRKIRCPLPKLPAPRNCEPKGDAMGANEFIKKNYPDAVGWYYCENEGEYFVDACDDKADNDQDGLADCLDEECKDCVHCGGAGTTCTQEKCRYGVELTAEGKDVTTGYFIDVQCLQQFSFEDENCQEDSHTACNNQKDDDGNGVMDCKGSDNTLADPNCCPMGPPDAENKCQPKLSEIKKICGNEQWNLIPACGERIAEEGCTAK